MLEAGKDYGVRVIRAYENKRKGDVIFPSGVLRQQLLRARFVERVAPHRVDDFHEKPYDGIHDEFRRRRYGSKAKASE